MVVRCAWAATHRKDSYYSSIACVAAKKAICAVAASMLTAIYHMLKDGTHHHDLGANHFEHRSAEIRVKRLAAQIAKLGYEVEYRPIIEAA